MAIDEAGKRLAQGLPAIRLVQQILVLGKEDATEGCGSIKEPWIRERSGAVLSSRQYVYTTCTLPGCDRSVYMVIHVRVNGHACWYFRPRRRSTIGGRGVRARSSSTSARSRAMSASISAWWSQ